MNVKVLDKQFESFMEDAPVCDQCGRDHRPQRRLLPLLQLRELDGVFLRE